MARTLMYTSELKDHATLTFINADGIVSSHVINNNETVGRKSENSRSSIQIPSQIVSRSHGEINVINDKFYYRDLGSLNGTYVNGTTFLSKDSTSQAAVLNDGDILGFDLCKDGMHHPDRTIAIFSRTLEDGASWEKVNLNSSIAEICIGRSIESGMKIDNDMISEKHASFFLASNGWAIIDHNSTNGVYVNGSRLSAPIYLKEFDVVRIADSYFVYLGNSLLISKQPASVSCNQDSNTIENIDQSAVRYQAPSSGDLVINILDRSVVSRFKKLMLLQDINLSISSGDMVLILGGSGAGKTTFINAVMGYEKARGTIMYRNTDIYKEYSRMQYEIGYVPQYDLLHMSDTVYKTLYDAAEMKLPETMTEQAKTNIVMNTLDRFGLISVKDSIVSKLSGGQRKRLSIANEFVSNPSLFILDEPDSGLDDIMGRKLMEDLRGIADLNKIVMVITHSPERGRGLFNKIIVLAKSATDNCGHLAFYGTVDEAFEFFGVNEFRDNVKKINKPDENGEGLADYFIAKYKTLRNGGF
jgi:ABC-type multidrug transport system ATPase subunit/pSer/pThr/pTyr-binding forkhead associated (FHA) protein